MLRPLSVLTLSVAVGLPAAAAIKTEEVKYTFDGIEFVGQVAYDDAAPGKRPGVLVVHEWWGLNAHAKDRAKRLAEMGYVALACDMYGKGQVTTHPPDAMRMSGQTRANKDVWRGRAAAALAALAAHPKCDGSKLGAIGFCFGGSTCLQLAYSGADLKAVCTFHAALTPLPTPAEAKAVKAKVVVCHGAADSFIKDADVAAFQAKLKEAGVPLEFNSYPGVVHSFTAPEADKVGNPGMRYDAKADAESWASMTKLFAEALK
jgi:dienelactone hydrolase